MKKPNHWGAVLLVPLFGIAAAEFLTPRTHAQDATSRPADRETANLFASKCASCHVYPDASLQTDRAWLGQIMETS